MMRPETYEDLLARARGGDRSALNGLLKLYRNYLRLLMEVQVHNHQGLPFDSSDVVQETLLDAFRDFADFRGHTDAEFLTWLRKILVHNLTDGLRHYRRRNATCVVSSHFMIRLTSRRVTLRDCSCRWKFSERTCEPPGERRIVGQLAAEPADKAPAGDRTASALGTDVLGDRQPDRLLLPCCGRMWIRALQDLRTTLRELQ